MHVLRDNAQLNNYSLHSCRKIEIKTTDDNLRNNTLLPTLLRDDDVWSLPYQTTHVQPPPLAVKEHL